MEFPVDGTHLTLSLTEHISHASWRWRWTRELKCKAFYGSAYINIGLSYLWKVAVLSTDNVWFSAILECVHSCHSCNISILSTLGCKWGMLYGLYHLIRRVGYKIKIFQILVGRFLQAAFSLNMHCDITHCWWRDNLLAMELSPS